MGAAAVLPSAAAGRATATAEQVPASIKLRSVDDLYSALEGAEVTSPRGPAEVDPQWAADLERGLAAGGGGPAGAHD